MKTREDAFADCERFFRELSGSTDPDFIRLRRNRIAAELVRLYQPYFLRLPSLQTLMSAADADGRKGGAPFGEPPPVSAAPASETPDEDAEGDLWADDAESGKAALEDDGAAWTAPSGNAFDCYMDTILYVLDHYDADKGELYPFFLGIFRHRLQDRSRNFYSQRLYITGFPVSVYPKADLTSPVLRVLTEQNTKNRDRSFRVYDVQEVGGQKWYKIAHQYRGSRIIGYVPASESVWLTDSSASESIEWENEDGEAEERTDIVPIREAGWSPYLEAESSFLRLENVWLMSQTQSFLQGKAKADAGKGTFSQYLSYRMLYTEYLVLILHEYNSVRPMKNEERILRNGDLQWLDYFMEKNCRSFDSIIRTRRHTFDHAKAPIIRQRQYCV